MWNKNWVRLQFEKLLNHVAVPFRVRVAREIRSVQHVIDLRCQSVTALSSARPSGYSNYSPLACSSARPPEAEILLVKQVVSVISAKREHRIFLLRFR